MAMVQPTIVLVDDDLAVMRCVAKCLSARHEIECLGIASHAQAGVALIQDKNPDVALFDIHMPGADAFWACRTLHEDPEVQTRILFFTGFPSDNYVDLCMEAGGWGIVSKHLDSLEELALAVRHVARDERYFCAEVAQRLVRREGGAVCSPLATLSDRERMVLARLAAGEPNRQIASGLEISLRSVEKDIAELKRKLGKTTTNELLIYAAKEGLVYPELSERV